VAEPWEFVLLLLAAYRTTRLLGWDTITDSLRRRATRLGSWQGGPLPQQYRSGLDAFLHCAFCLGFWIGLAWWAVWLAIDEWALWAATPWALSAAIGLIARQWDP